MALQLKQDGYIINYQITRTRNLNGGDKSVMIRVEGTYDSSSKEGPYLDRSSRIFATVADVGDGSLTECYNYIKTLPEYLGSIDI